MRFALLLSFIFLLSCGGDSPSKNISLSLSFRGLDGQLELVLDGDSEALLLDSSELESNYEIKVSSGTNLKISKSPDLQVCQFDNGLGEITVETQRNLIVSCDNKLLVTVRGRQPIWISDGKTIQSLVEGDTIEKTGKIYIKYGKAFFTIQDGDGKKVWYSEGTKESAKILSSDDINHFSDIRNAFFDNSFILTREVDAEVEFYVYFLKDQSFERVFFKDDLTAGYFEEANEIPLSKIGSELTLPHSLISILASSSVDGVHQILRHEDRLLVIFQSDAEGAAASDFKRIYSFDINDPEEYVEINIPDLHEDILYSQVTSVGNQVIVEAVYREDSRNCSIFYELAEQQVLERILNNCLESIHAKLVTPSSASNELIFVDENYHSSNNRGVISGEGAFKFNAYQFSKDTKTLAPIFENDIYFDNPISNITYYKNGALVGTKVVEDTHLSPMAPGNHKFTFLIWYVDFKNNTKTKIIESTAHKYQLHDNIVNIYYPFGIFWNYILGTSNINGGPQTGEYFFFPLYRETTGFEMWATDGTGANTSILEINSGPDSGLVCCSYTD